MKLYWIKDKYIFSKKSHGRHLYAAWKDRRSGKTRLVRFAHLFVYDKKRKPRLDNGELAETPIKGFKLPQGVSTSYRTKDIEGKDIDLKALNARPYRRLGLRDSIRVKRTAKKIDKDEK